MTKIDGQDNKSKFLALTKRYGWIVVEPAMHEADEYLTVPGKYSIKGDAIFARMPLPPTTAPKLDSPDIVAKAFSFEVIRFGHHAKFDHVREMRIERRSHDPESWTIVSGSPAFGFGSSVLARDGFWEIEPRPLAITEEFMRRCRWPSVQSAMEFVRDHLARYPTGDRPFDDEPATDAPEPAA